MNYPKLPKLTETETKQEPWKEIKPEHTFVFEDKDDNKISVKDLINSYSMEHDVRGVNKKIFDWLIKPVTRKQFYSEFYEEKPFVVRRPEHTNYY